MFAPMPPMIPPMLLARNSATRPGITLPYVVPNSGYLSAGNLSTNSFLSAGMNSRVVFSIQPCMNAPVSKPSYSGPLTGSATASAADAFLPDFPTRPDRSSPCPGRLRCCAPAMWNVPGARRALLVPVTFMAVPFDVPVATTAEPHTRAGRWQMTLNHPRSESTSCELTTREPVPRGFYQRLDRPCVRNNDRPTPPESMA